MGIMEYVWKKTAKTPQEDRGVEPGVEIQGASGNIVDENHSLFAYLKGEHSAGIITKKEAEAVPAVSGCLSFIAGCIAQMPVKLYKETDGKVQEVKGDTRTRLLNDETGDTLNASQFWRAVVRDYYLDGGAYAYINKQNMAVASIHFVPAEKVSLNKNTDSIFKKYWMYVDGKQYFPHDFVKILRKTEDGSQGKSIVQEASEILGVAYNTIVLERELVANGGNKKGVIKAASTLAPEAVEMLKEAYKKFYGNNSENMLILNAGLDFMQLSNTSVEMQLYENKKQNAFQICQLFQVPQKVAEGSGTDEEYTKAVKMAVMPLVRDIECALNRDLLLEDEKAAGYFFAIDTSEMLKADIKKRFDAYKVALDANFMQIDEVRFRENMEPLGINFLKLGLNDVLMDPETQDVYTPNTGQWASLKGGE